MNAVKEVGGTINEQHSYSSLSFSQKRKVRKLLKGFVSLSPSVRSLGDKIGYEELLKVVQLGREIADSSYALADIFFARSSDWIDKIGYNGLVRIALHTKKIAEQKKIAPFGFILVGPDLINRIGCDGLDKIVELGYNVAIYDAAAANNLIGNSPKLINRLLKYGNKEQAMSVLDIGKEIAKRNGRVAADFISKSPEVIRESGYEGLVRLAKLEEGAAEKAAKLRAEAAEKAAKFKKGAAEEYFKLEKEVAKQNSDIAFILRNKDITTGSRQLIAGRYLNRLAKGLSRDDALQEANRLYSEVKNLERILEGTPTFGCEFVFEKENVTNQNFKYNFSDGIMLANALLKLAGNKRQKTSILYYPGHGGIRSCEDLGKMAEFRINPSYAPITIALVKEMFGLGIFPSDVIATYTVNIVGEDVLNYTLPLILTNYVTGLTPCSETDNFEKDNDALNFRDVHVYRGATVDPKTGILTNDDQLNIKAGITGKIDDNKELMSYKEILEKDVNVRISKMLMPFLVSEGTRNRWGDDIIKCFGISGKKTEHLQKRLEKAKGDGKKWNCSSYVNMIAPEIQMLEVERVYRRLEEKIACGNPGLYLQISNAKL